MTQDHRRFYDSCRIADIDGMTGEYPNVFVLGCTASRVSFLAQQTRALNLITVLAASEPRLSALKICVIGGGVAGVTAASHAQQLGYDVTLIEQYSRVLTLQAGSSRWVHPNIYEWPNAGWRTERTHLPTMNWHAATAADVIRQLRGQWDAVDRRVILNARVSSLARNGERWEVGYTSPDGSPAGSVMSDIVILALGYGEERNLEHLRSPPYWTESDVHQRLRRGGVVLVSGCGDGGLIDVIRLCINDFDHASLIELGDRLETPALRDALLKIEHDHGGYGGASALSKAYGAVPVLPSELRHLEKLRRKDVRVLLNARGRGPLTRSSAILHRLLTALLIRLGSVEFVSGLVDPGEIKLGGDGKYIVPVGITSRVVDGVVLRHGPRSALAASFPAIAELVAPTMHWHMRHRVASDDRKALWASAEPTPKSLRSRIVSTPPTPPPAVAVAPSPGSSALPSAVSSPAGTPAIGLPPAEHRAWVAFGRELESTVRALCTAMTRATVTTKVDCSLVRVCVRLEPGGSAGLEEAAELEMDALPDNGKYAVTLWRVDAPSRPRVLGRMRTPDAAQLAQALAELIGE